MLVRVRSLGCTLGSSAVATRDRRDLLCSRRFTTARQVGSNSFEISCVHSCASAVSLAFIAARFGVVRFIQIRMVSLWRG